MVFFKFFSFGHDVCLENLHSCRHGKQETQRKSNFEQDIRISATYINHRGELMKRQFCLTDKHLFCPKM